MESVGNPAGGAPQLHPANLSLLHPANALLRLLTWLAYVAADMVAVYALGLISRDDQSTTTSPGSCHGNKGSNGLSTGTSRHLAFLWAPFLLIHLGGQDTISAFSIEDNNLWLRHLLNLTIQVSLALYAFWKSIGGRNQRLLAPAVLVFVAGIIRYGERTWALKCGSRNGLKETSLPPLPKLNVEVDKSSYVGTICYVLGSMAAIRDLFSGRTTSQMKERRAFRFQEDRPLDQVPKLLEVELAMMYDDLYTKAMVLRTRTCVVLRCVSQVSSIAAFVLFLVGNDRQEYSGTDIAITYALFIGGLSLDVCAFVPIAMSPWTWAFFKARRCERLARISWLVLSSRVGWPEKRPLWSNSMGQYNFLSSCMGCEQSATSSKLMTVMRKMLDAVEKKLFVRNLQHTKHAKVSKVAWVGRLSRENFTRMTQQQHWANLRPIIKATLSSAANSFGDNIILLHTYTELHLRKRPSNMDDEALSDMCRKLANYMVYLLVVQPSMLPLSGTAEDTLAGLYEEMSKNGSRERDVLDTAYHLVEDKLEFGYEECLKEQEQPGPWRETLTEIQDMWMRLLLYAAGKCPVEMHAQQLGRGGELLTMVWLLMAHNGIGDVGDQVELITNDETMEGPFCAFHLPKESEHMSA
ncbi:hypothetical protein CFC21_056804 [Triticum aestivum]|uniref:DUF4220 domain-containing protein n=3 Tax=Triticum TaxID=4564 RepID=A0A9R0WAB7_TRITD|nr:uncharacterized protein LOC123091196 [Triticum aestivum]KAF7047971.1 hypothetical protein CFC21_056804 [Triticum aestivum]VAI02762.1 unnamed protein product [Triticum turgidum subsp. durum]